MNVKTKGLVMVPLSIFLVLIILFTGCAQTPQEPEQTTPPAKTSPGATTEPETQPAKSQTPESMPVQTPVTETGKESIIQKEPESDLSQLAPSVTPSLTTKFDVSKAPRVGEAVDLSFMLDWIGDSEPMTRVWLEFERYDPALYYPLGWGKTLKMQKDILSRLNKSGEYYPNYIYLKEGAKAQPESTVPAESVVLSGNTVWEGYLKGAGRHVRFDTAIRFPEEGEWEINAWWQKEGEEAKIIKELYLTVNQNSGFIGWQKLFPSSGSGRTGTMQGTSESYPVDAVINIPHAPLAGETVPLTISVESIMDMEGAKASLKFERRDGYSGYNPSADEIVTEGASMWQGDLKKGERVEFSCVIKFPTEGDWQIGALTNAPGGRGHGSHAIFIHVGKDKSRFGWLEDHYRPTYDPLRPIGQPTSLQELPVPGKGTKGLLSQVTVTGNVIFNKRVQGVSAARYCRIFLQDQYGYYLYATGHTDGDGNFSLGPIENPGTAYLKVYSYGLIRNNGEDLIDVGDNGSPSLAYYFMTENAITIPPDGDIGTTQIPLDESTNPIWWIKDDLETGYDLGNL